MKIKSLLLGIATLIINLFIIWFFGIVIIYGTTITDTASVIILSMSGWAIFNSIDMISSLFKRRRKRNDTITTTT